MNCFREQFCDDGLHPWISIFTVWVIKGLWSDGEEHSNWISSSRRFKGTRPAARGFCGSRGLLESQPLPFSRPSCTDEEGSLMPWKSSTWVGWIKISSLRLHVLLMHSPRLDIYLNIAVQFFFVQSLVSEEACHYLPFYVGAHSGTTSGKHHWPSHRRWWKRTQSPQGREASGLVEALALNPGYTAFALMEDEGVAIDSISPFWFETDEKEEDID